MRAMECFSDDTDLTATALNCWKTYRGSEYRNRKVNGLEWVISHEAT